MNKAGLVDILGDAGSINVQGEDVKKLDISPITSSLVYCSMASAAPVLPVKKLMYNAAFDDAASEKIQSTFA